MKILSVKSREDFNLVNAPAGRVLIWPQINADGTVTLYCKTPSGEVSTITGGSGGGSGYDDSELRGLLADKVDKVSGKQLSANDYTDAEKQKLAALKTVAATGSYNDLTDKPAIPSNVSELANDAGYITAAAIPPIPSALSDLSDVSDLSGASNGQALVWDSAAQKWRPGTVAADEKERQISLHEFTHENLLDGKLTLLGNVWVFAVIDELGAQYPFAPEEVICTGTETIVDLAVTMQRRNLSGAISGVWKLIIAAKESVEGTIFYQEFIQADVTADKTLILDADILAFAVIDEQGIQYPFAPEEIVYTGTETIVDLAVTMQRRNLGDAIPGTWKIVAAKSEADDVIPPIPSDLSDLSDTSGILAAKTDAAMFITPGSTAQYEQIPIGPTRTYKTLAAAYAYMQTKSTSTNKGFKLVLDAGNYEGISFVGMFVEIWSADTNNKATITTAIAFTNCYRPALYDLNFNIGVATTSAINLTYCFTPLIYRCSITARVALSNAIQFTACTGGIVTDSEINLQTIPGTGVLFSRNSNTAIQNTRISNCTNAIYVQLGSTVYTTETTIATCTRGLNVVASTIYFAGSINDCTDYGIYAVGGSVVEASTDIIHSTVGSYGIQAVHGAIVRMTKTSAKIMNYTYGAYAESGKITFANDATISTTSGTYGIFSSKDSNVIAPAVSITGYNSGVYATGNGKVDLTTGASISTTSGIYGIYAINSSSVLVTNATISGYSFGVYAIHGSFISFSGAVTGSSNYGIFSNMGSRIVINSTTSISGYVIAVTATNNGLVHAPVSSMTITGATTEYSPAKNTVGNNNSIIIG